MAEQPGKAKSIPVRPLVAGAAAAAWLALMLALVAAGSQVPRALGVRVINLIAACVFAGVWGGLALLGRQGPSDS